jgi:hypothetical protein
MLAMLIFSLVFGLVTVRNETYKLGMWNWSGYTVQH